MSADQPNSQAQVTTQSSTRHPSTPPANSKFTFESPITKQHQQMSQDQTPSIQQQPIPSLQHHQSYHQLKVPSTPSTKRTSGVFDTSILQTPERTPQQLLNEGTPLLSPSITYSVHSSSQKRRSTDFYSLLRSPEVNRYNNNSDKNIMGSPDVKRRSMELNKIINKTSPERNIPTSPGFIFHDTILSSPKRVSPYRISKKNEVEIKEISENLKTRLNYAKLKIKHGWSNNTINELEQKLNDDSQISSNDSKYNEFWNMKSDTLPGSTEQQQQKQQQQRKRPLTTPIVTTTNITNSPRRRSSNGNSKFSLDDIATNKQGNSAETALFKALSPEKSKLPSAGTSDEKLEQEAIMSLMSLSSPVKYSASASPSPPEKPIFHKTKSSISSGQKTPVLSGNPMLISSIKQSQEQSHSRNSSYQLSKPPHLPPPMNSLTNVSLNPGGLSNQKDGDETEDETDIELDDQPQVPQVTTGLGIRQNPPQQIQMTNDGEETASEHSDID